MKIGLIDVDGHNYPNLPLMKLSAWHKAKGDTVEWYDPFLGLMEEYDKVYMSKVFSFTPDYDRPIYAKEIERGGQDIVLRLRVGKKYSMQNGIKTCLTRQSIFTLIIRYTPNKLKIRHTDF